MACIKEDEMFGITQACHQVCMRMYLKACGIIFRFSVNNIYAHQSLHFKIMLPSVIQSNFKRKSTKILWYIFQLMIHFKRKAQPPTNGGQEQWPMSPTQPRLLPHLLLHSFLFILLPPNNPMLESNKIHHSTHIVTHIKYIEDIASTLFGVCLLKKLTLIGSLSSLSS